MEKELKIAELATIWGVSIPTTWNRIKKLGLTTFKKKDENNKDITYTTISDEQIKEYIINVNNNNNNPINNGYYEDMLNNKNVNNPNTDIIDVEYTRAGATLTPVPVSEITEIYNRFNEQLINVNELHNEYIKNVYEEIKNVYEELANHKSNTQLLEDKRASEGAYLNEIKELKQEKEILNKDNNDLKIANNNLNNEKENALKNYKELSEKYNKIESEKEKIAGIDKIKNAVIAVCIVVLAIFITFFIMNNKPVNNVQEPVIEQPVEVVAPQPANVPNPRKK